jgi:uncharacterized protein (DUF1800 family)
VPKTQTMLSAAKRHRSHGRALHDPGPLPVYRGRFRSEHAERLLWRAGFGPKPGEAQALAKRGLREAVHSLTRPRDRRLIGPRPVQDNGQPIQPFDVWGNDLLWFLDRMVRSQAPLIERMTLNWHGWFACSNEGVDSARLMIAQNQTQRRLCLASFPRMLSAMTTDPAMQLYLSLAGSTKYDPNENYARELQELYTLGADNGYSEDDVREHARALTGWQSSWNSNTGQPEDFHYDPKLHDDGIKVIYGHRGNFDWRDSLRLVLTHPDHPRFFVTKLWGCFCPEPLSSRDRLAAEYLYVSKGKQIRPLVEAFLMHPQFQVGARMVKPPIVQLAGMLRGTGRYIDTEAWAWECSLMGQVPFYPPNVAGWDASAWLNTGTWLARFNVTANVISAKQAIPAGTKRVSTDPATLLRQARKFWGGPTLSKATSEALRAYAKDAISKSGPPEQNVLYAGVTANALRALIVASPDYQTC